MMRRGIAGIYLAAGQSRRMGADKLALPLGCGPLGSRALRAALLSRLDRILVVVREGADLQWMNVSGLPDAYAQKMELTPCAEASRGQAHSLRCGVKAAQAVMAEAVMILLADQPFVTAELMNRIIGRYAENIKSGNGSGYVAASYEGLLRPPVLFPHKLFSALWELEGDEGARRLLRTGTACEGNAVVVEDERYFLDADTPEHYLTLTRSLSYRQRGV